MTRTAERGRPATSTRQPAVCIRRTPYPRAVFKRFRAQAYNPGVSGVQEEMPSGRGKHTRAWLRRGFLPGPPTPRHLRERRALRRTCTCERQTRAAGPRPPREACSDPGSAAGGAAGEGKPARAGSLYFSH